MTMPDHNERAALAAAWEAQTRRFMVEWPTDEQAFGAGWVARGEYNRAAPSEQIVDVLEAVQRPQVARLQAEVARLKEELLRVTAERDDWRERGGSMTDRELLERLQATMAEMAVLIDASDNTPKYWTKKRLLCALSDMAEAEKSLAWHVGPDDAR